MNETIPPVHDEDRYAILARSTLTTRVLKHGDTFGVFDRAGDIRALGPGGAEGLYHEGTRFLSLLRMKLCRERLLLLSSTVRENNLLLAADLMNPDLAREGQDPIAHGALHVLRSRFLWQAACYEHIRISNYSDASVDIRLEIAFAADFVDVFEVRGTERKRRGTLEPVRHDEASVVLGYVALDGVKHFTRLRFAPAPITQFDDRVEFQLRLEPKQAQDITLTVQCQSGTSDLAPSPPAFEQAYADASHALNALADEACSLQSSNEDFNAWVGRSIADLHMLITPTPYGPYPYAGVPWFSTPFGRDGIITALEALWVNPNIARGVLGFLAGMQADRIDEAADSEPGKILHELRHGEMARLHEIPFGRYYGSVDSTPLFVVLAAAYHEASGDDAFIQDIWPHIERALQWLDDYGDADHDTFVEYDRKTHDGLVHQGWKDSHDSVFHADGSLAEGPIALCEVQGYAYAARRGAARLARLLGQTAQAVRLDLQADTLRASFDEAFWCEDLGMYALALDGKKRPCRVRTSNPGQCLLMGIVLPERADRLAEQLLAPEMFSGWGIRTVATTEARYNPMSYHNGSIWPHDNALIAAGLARYGLTQPAMRVLEAMFDASRYVELHRLPELFCGFPRRPGEGPTLYPVACSPQAWVAAAPLLLLQATLGMSTSAPEGCVRFDHAALPPFVDEVYLRKLKVGDASVDLCLHRYPDNVGLNVLQRHGKLDVIAVK